MIGVALLAAYPGIGADADGAEVAVTGTSRAEAARLVSVALQDEWLRAQTAGQRLRPVEVVVPDDGKSRAVVWLVDYTDGHSIALEVEGEVVLSRSIRPIGLPNMSPSERDTAARVAVADAKVREVSDGRSLVVNNITTSTGSSCDGGRCLAVFLTPLNGGEPALIVAIVDLRLDAVIELLP